MSLKSQKSVIIIALILKGILLYSTIGFAVYTLFLIDGNIKDWIYQVIVLVALITLCAIYISKNAFKRIMFLSKEERKEFESETV